MKTFQIFWIVSLVILIYSPYFSGVISPQFLNLGIYISINQFFHWLLFNFDLISLIDIVNLTRGNNSSISAQESSMCLNIVRFPLIQIPSIAWIHQILIFFIFFSDLSKTTFWIFVSLVKWSLLRLRFCLIHLRTISIFWLGWILYEGQSLYSQLTLR